MEWNMEKRRSEEGELEKRERSGSAGVDGARLPEYGAKWYLQCDAR